MANDPLEGELQQHAAALRSLARALVDPADADDLVQDTALRALRSPPPRPGGLGAFLRTVLRRLASSRRRDDARRRQRETAAAKPEAIPSAAQDAARHEVIARLTQALLSLPEPYRDVLLQRYFEDCWPAAIAARAGVPVETVKTRIKRGLAMLREQLEAQGARQGGWRAGLIGAFGLSRGAAMAVGVVAMGTSVKLAIGGAAMVAVAVATWWAMQPGAMVSPPAQIAGDAVLSPVVADAGGTTGSTERVAVAAPPAEEAARSVVEGTVRDAAGTPMAGVNISGRLIEAARAATVLPATSSDAQGHFALALPREAPVELVFSYAGHRPHREMVRAPLSGIDVVLERSPMLQGCVVRGDGTPVGGALVRWSTVVLGPGAGASTTTGTDGRFAFADLPRSLDLEILAPDALPVFRDLANVTWGMPELTVTVEEGRKAMGTVVDGASGAGIAGASVSLWYFGWERRQHGAAAGQDAVMYHGSTYTAEGRRGGPSQLAETVLARTDGTFTLTRLPSAWDKSRPAAWLWVTAPGRAPHWQVVALPERAETLQVTLHRAGSVRGRVVDAAGAPVAGQRIYAEAKAQPLCDAGPNVAFRRQDGGYGRMWSTRRPEVVAPFQGEREAFTDLAGAYVLDGIPCPIGGGEVTVAVIDDSARVTVAARPGEVVVAEDLVLPEGRCRRWHGSVRDENARPVAGALVEVGGTPTRTDAQGRFDLEVPGNVQGKLTLRASAFGYVPIRRALLPSAGRLFVECDEGGVAITLARAFRLAVVIVDRAQRPVPDAAVQFFAAGTLAEFGSGGPRPVDLGRGFSDDRGAVLLEGVPASCDVLVEPDWFQPVHRRILASVAAAAGTLHVTLDDLDLSAGTRTLAIRVLDARTETGHAGMVLVEAMSANDSRRRLMPGPDVRLDGLSPGAWEVRVAAEGLGARSERVDLREDQRLDVRLGQGPGISGQVTCAALPLARPLQVSARDLATKRLCVARTDAAGRFALAGLEPGEYQLAVEPFESDAFASWPMRTPQDHASRAPVEVRVVAGAEPAPVTLPVVPVLPFDVEVVPDAAAGAAPNLWSWAQSLHFTVADEQGRAVYAGGPSVVMAAAAALSLRLPEARYTVAVRYRGGMLGERMLSAGESWQLQQR